MRSRLITLLPLLALLISGCAGFDAQAYVPGLETATVMVPRSTATAAVPRPSPIASNTPSDFTVCTGIPNGKLHVRFGAGDKSEVRGYVLEEESMTVTAERKLLPDGSTWIKLKSPIAGWVNARYVCLKGNTP